MNKGYNKLFVTSNQQKTTPPLNPPLFVDKVQAVTALAPCCAPHLENVPNGVANGRSPSAANPSPDPSQNLSPAAALGRDAEYVRDPSNEDPYSSQRDHIFAMRRTARGLRGPLSRIHNCGWALQAGAGSVDVVLRTHGKSRRASFRGVQHCGSPWICPVCQLENTVKRREEVKKIVKFKIAKGDFLLLATYTARHGRDDNLADFFGHIRGAKGRIQRLSGWRKFKSTLCDGTITATEVTHGYANGWHPHFHVLMFVSGVETEAEAIQSVEFLRDDWLASLEKEGLSGNGAAFDVRGASEAGAYITKWGADQEIVSGSGKAARKGNRSAFQLLSDATDGDDQAAALWNEYADAVEGCKQLVFSKNLRAECGLNEIKDEEIDQSEPETEVIEPETEETETKTEEIVFKIEAYDWRTRGRYCAAAILKAVETKGINAAIAVLFAEPYHPYRYDTEPIRPPP